MKYTIIYSSVDTYGIRVTAYKHISLKENESFSQALKRYKIDELSIWFVFEGKHEPIVLG